MTNSLIGAVDIGGTKIAAGAVTETGTIVARAECPTVPREGFAVAMCRTAAMLREVSRQAGAGYRGIGIACPGPLNPFTGIIGDVGTLPGWQGGDLVAALTGEFEVPIAVENDADAAALAEAGWGAAADNRGFIYVTISTGIGAGVILSGQLYRGAEGAHPEIGHHVLDWSGPLCYCGARGCWEVLASGPGMTAWFREQSREQRELSAAEICELSRHRDELAVRAIEREGFYIGLGLANLITMFTPEAIALGGGLMRSADLFLDKAREVIRAVATQVPAANTKIALASLGPDTGLLGGARAWLHRYSAA